jgi:hypothetical protein
MLGVMPFFEIFFYTAGVRTYGEGVMEIIKDLVMGK